jgi:hypothetical protein
MRIAGGLGDHENAKARKGENGGEGDTKALRTQRWLGRMHVGLQIENCRLRIADAGRGMNQDGRFHILEGATFQRDRGCGQTPLKDSQSKRICIEAVAPPSG